MAGRPMACTGVNSSPRFQPFWIEMFVSCAVCSVQWSTDIGSKTRRVWSSSKQEKAGAECQGRGGRRAWPVSGDRGGDGCFDASVARASLSSVNRGLWSSGSDLCRHVARTIVERRWSPRTAFRLPCRIVARSFPDANSRAEGNAFCDLRKKNCAFWTRNCNQCVGWTCCERLE